MVHSLLIALDGSAFAEHALPLALALARRAGAPLEAALVHVPLAFLDVEGMSAYALEEDARAEKRERAYLDDWLRRTAANSPAPLTVKLLEGLGVAETLNNHAVARGVDLVVMTTHGRGPLTRAWLGGVADELVRRSAAPVLVIRPREAAPDLTREPEIRRILIPLDGSALAEKVLAPALELGTLTGAEYTLLRVVDPATAGESSAGALRAEAEAYLGRVAERLKGLGARVRTRVVSGRQPAVAILEEAATGGGDLIALATHGRRGAARLLLGGVADKAPRGASTPIMIYKPSNK